MKIPLLFTLEEYLWAIDGGVENKREQQWNRGPCRLYKAFPEDSQTVKKYVSWQDTKGKIVICDTLLNITNVA